MAPSGLVISKLGIQATASQDHLKGLLCLKVSLPRDNAGKPGARWALFSSQAPKLISEPTIHSLPLRNEEQNRNERIASRLLSLPPPSNTTSYPPSSPSTVGIGSNPYIDVSSTTGKIFLVLDPSTGVGVGGGKYSHRTKTKTKTETNESPRKDWLVCLEFQIPLEDTVEQSVSQVILPLPRCLDNVIRLHVASHPWPSSSRHSGDIDILAEPKVLPLPSSAFKSPSLPPTKIVDRKRKLSSGAKRHIRRSGHMVEDEAGWEDAEIYPQEEVYSQSEEEYDPETIGGEDEEDDMSEDGGSWLQGRFQSTDMLKLRWSLAASSQEDDLPSLTVNPRWDNNNPAIDLVYSAHVDDIDSTISLDVDVPEGWGWSELTIQGEGLTRWRCLDGPWEETFIENQELDPDATLDLPQYEDSFATVRAKRQRAPTLTQQTLPSTSSASLMRQTLPVSPDMDFSFEAGSLENVLDPVGDPKMLLPPSLRTPRAQSILASARKSPSTKSSIATAPPKSGRQFDLTFESSEENEIGLVLQGTLVPLNTLTLVSPTLPIHLPLIRLGSHSELDTRQCLVICPGARYLSTDGADKSNTNTSTSPARQVCDLDAGGFFIWLDQRGQPFQPLTSSTVAGNVQIRLHRNIWGIITMSMLLPWPRRTEELGFTLHPVQEARVIKVTDGDILMPRALYKDDEGVQIRLGRGKRDGKVKDDKVEVVLEVSCEGTIGLPSFEKAKGNMVVELCGPNWDDKAISTNMIRSTSTSSPKLTYTCSLDSPLPTITFTSASTTSASSSRNQDKVNWLKWAIFNPATMLNVLLIWILISTVARVDNLQRELSFVADEARDLRLFGFDRDRDHASAERGDIIHQPNKAESGRGDLENSKLAGDELASSLAMVDMETSSKIREHERHTESVGEFDAHDQGPLSGSSRSAGGGGRSVERQRENAKYPLGRVVFDQSNWTWGTLTKHPSVQTISQSMAWIWNTVIWMILHK